MLALLLASDVRVKHCMQTSPRAQGYCTGTVSSRKDSFFLLAGSFCKLDHGDRRSTTLRTTPPKHRTPQVSTSYRNNSRNCPTGSNIDLSLPSVGISLAAIGAGGVVEFATVCLPRTIVRWSALESIQFPDTTYCPPRHHGGYFGIQDQRKRRQGFR